MCALGKFSSSPFYSSKTILPRKIRSLKLREQPGPPQPSLWRTALSRIERSSANPRSPDGRRKASPQGPSRHPGARGGKHPPGRGLQIVLPEEILLITEQLQLLHQVLHHYEHVVGRARPPLHDHLPCFFATGPRHPILQTRRCDHCCGGRHSKTVRKSAARARTHRPPWPALQQPDLRNWLPGDRLETQPRGYQTPPPSKFPPTRVGFQDDVAAPAPSPASEKAVAGRQPCPYGGVAFSAPRRARLLPLQFKNRVGRVGLTSVFSRWSLAGVAGLVLVVTQGRRAGVRVSWQQFKRLKREEDAQY